MGIAVVVALVQAHQGHGVPHPALDTRLVVLAVDAQGLGQGLGHGEGWVQAARRILKDHLGPLGMMGHRAGHVALHAQHRTGQGRFAAATLAHQTEDLAPVQGKADIMEHLMALLAQPRAAAVPHIQVIYFQNRF